MADNEALDLTITKRRGRPRKSSMPVKQQAVGSGDEVGDVSHINLTLSSKAVAETMSCILCNKQLNGRAALEHHFMVDHTRVWKPDFPEGVDNNTSLGLILKKLKKLKCQQCLKEFNGVQYYKFHREWCGRELEEMECEQCHKLQKAMWMGHHSRSCRTGKDKSKESSDGSNESPLKPERRRSAAVRALKTLEALNVGGLAYDEHVNKDEDAAFQAKSDESDMSNEEELAKDLSDEEAGNSGPRQQHRSGGKVLKDTHKFFNPLPGYLVDYHKYTYEAQMELQLLSESTADFVWISPPDTWMFKPINTSDKLQRCATSLNVQLYQDGKLWMHTIEPLHSVVSSDASYFCNVGSPVCCIAWCPIPLTSGPELQYLAVSPQLASTIEDMCLPSVPIQIWSFGSLEESTNTVPSCSFLVEHDYGQLWDLKWCPYGASRIRLLCKNASAADQEHSNLQLGILAVAASDGNAYLLSIPTPIPEDCCKVVSQRQNVRLAGGRSPCLCVEWQQKGATIIAAGFLDGTISLWDLKAENHDMIALDFSQPLVKTPFESFMAHPACIQSLAWCPNSAHLFASASTQDRCISIWDIRDLSASHSNTDQHGLMPTDLQWAAYLDGLIVASDDACRVHENPVHFHESGYLGIPSRVLQSTATTVWRMSFSGWAGCLTACNSGGSVLLTVLPNLYRLRKSSEIRTYELMQLRLQDPSSFKGKPACGVNVELTVSNLCQLSKPSKPDRLAKDKQVKFNEPAASFMQVAFNPNPGCHPWLASASSCGLLVVAFLKSLLQTSHNSLLSRAREKCTQ